MIWAMAFGLPLLIFWVFGLIIAGFLFLFFNRKRVEDPKFVAYFILLVQGYWSKTYYWEFANFLRKIIIVSINSLIPSSLQTLIILLSLTIALFFWRLNLSQHPYKNMQYNQLERWEMICSIITLHFALVFINSNVSVTLSIVLFSILMIVNLWFWGAWIYLFIAHVIPKWLWHPKLMKFLQIASIMKTNMTSTGN